MSLPAQTQGEKARVLVTGATGNVGRELVQQLVASGNNVRILVRDPSKSPQPKNLIEVSVGDLDKPDTLLKAMSGIESIFLLTGNTQQDRNVIGIGKQTGLHHIVKLSTYEAGLVPVRGHGVWHREREELIEASGLAWTFLRPSMFMNTVLSWTGTIKQEGVVRFSGGAGKLAPVDPWDAAVVALTALTRPGHERQSYTLTGPELLSFPEMTQILASVIGKPIRYVEESDEDFAKEMLKANLPKYVVDGLVDTMKFLARGDFAHITDSVEKVTGRKPRTFEFWCKEHKSEFE